MDENHVRGTCQTMCPKKEAFLRRKEKLLHKFEMKKGTECNRLPEYDPEKIVKSFNRSSAGADTTNPANLRPYPVLLKTVNYLCREVFPFHVEKPVFTYDFMFDRFRAVRQDAIIQNLSQEETIRILEPIVKFLIYFGYILIEEDARVFDSHINSTHLQECMKRLLICYDESEETNRENQWEIESAYLLFNLGNIKALTRGVRQHRLKPNKIYCDCLDLSFGWYQKNYKRVCESMLDLPPLLLCVANASLPEIRKYSLGAMACAYSCVNSAYPISNLRCLLLFKSDNQAEEECVHFNIKVKDGKINFWKKDFDFSAKPRKGVKLNFLDEKLSKCDILNFLHFDSNS